MAENLEISACKAIIKALFSSDYQEVASIFYKPVDGYQVDEPMDLSTVRDRLNSGAYPTGDAFAKDVRLIFRNASTNPEHLCYEMGKKVEIIFEDLYKKVKEDPSQLLMDSDSDSEASVSGSSSSESTMDVDEEGEESSAEVSPSEANMNSDNEEEEAVASESMMSEDEEGEESSPEVNPSEENMNAAISIKVETMEATILAREPTMSTAEIEGQCPPDVDQFLASTLPGLAQNSELLLNVSHLIHEQEGIELNSENVWLCFKINKLKLYTKGLLCMYLAQKGIKYN